MSKLRLSLIFLLFLQTKISAQQYAVATPQWRPLYHFTPEKNWTNDPNGVVYVKNTYHLFNQQNPYENKWGHMSWGHATSTDLVHWKHLPIAMQESIDKDTTWRFSGSAVWDKNNTSGFCKPGGCIVAVYTADQPNLKKESQFIAYSNNDGIMLENYEGNPVIDLHKKDFRDPNVSWNDQLKKWLMAVALPRENQVRFYASPDLKKWELLSEFGPAGIKGGIWECPSFFSLPIEGDPAKKKWVLMTSFGGKKNPMMQYFIGDFDGKKFTNDNSSDSIMLVDYGDCFYAAIPWNDQPGKERILIGWMVPAKQETSPWRGQMSIPRDMILKETKNGIRLFQRPTSVIEKKLTALSANNFFELREIKITEGDHDLLQGHNIGKNAYWIKAEFSVAPDAVAGLRICTKPGENNKISSAITIGFDENSKEVFIKTNQTRGGEATKDRQIIPVKSGDGKVKLEILLDRSSLEVFVNDGEQVLSTYVFPGEHEDGISAFSSGGSAILYTFSFYDLSGIK